MKMEYVKHFFVILYAHNTLLTVWIFPKQTFLGPKQVNRFIPNASFLYPLKTSEK